MSRPNPRNLTINMAAVIVGAILLFALVGTIIMLKVYSDKADAVSGSATFDGIGQPQIGVQLYRSEGKLWEGCPAFFSEPFETVVFIFRDGKYLTYSTHDEKHINVPISVIAEDIVKSGHPIRECLLCVHNHFSPVGFTRGDEAAFEYLKRKGFKGVFGIYYTATGRFLGVED